MGATGNRIILRISYMRIPARRARKTRSSAAALSEYSSDIFVYVLNFRLVGRGVISRTDGIRENLYLFQVKFFEGINNR